MATATNYPVSMPVDENGTKIDFGALFASGGGASAWVNPARVTIDVAAATVILAAATATKKVLLTNEGADSVRIRFDGTDSSSITGPGFLLTAGGQFVLTTPPTGKISGYSAAGTTVAVMYV